MRITSRSSISAQCLMVGLFAIGPVGCGSPEPAVELAKSAASPMIGKADAAADRADRDCQVVLRSISREFTGDGYRTECVDGVCNWVWNGTVEVPEALAGSAVGVLYRLADGETWWQVVAKPVPTPVLGFIRYQFSIHEHLFGSDGDAASIEVMPFVTLADGSRLFDHNYHTGDFENHRLEQTNGFGMAYEPACRPAESRITFTTHDWYIHQAGALRQGGYLTIDYRIERLPECRGTHNGYPAWDTVAYVRFSPGGETVSESVRTFDTPQGVPVGGAGSKVFTTKVPANATGVEIWFRNYSGAGNSCETWDSNFGKNYRYEVWPTEDDPRCVNTRKWTKVNSDVPYQSKEYCLPYTVDEQRDAKDCEFYVSGIGEGHVGHYGIPNRWIEAYLQKGSLQGELFNVGMVTLYRDKADNTQAYHTTIGRPVDANTWQTGFSSLRTGYRSGSYDYEVQALAFFMDVKLTSGKIVRVWQSRHGANYPWNSIFTAGSTRKYIAYGSIKYAVDGASIFDVKRTCR